MDPAQLQSIVKRVTRRVLSRGRAASAQGRVSGVQVDLGLQDAEQSSLAPTLVTAEDLATVRDGEQYTLPAGARLTALAEEEAWRRRIRLSWTTRPTSGGLRVAIGADHGGFPIKESIKGWLTELGHVAIDLGTHDSQAVDYPDLAQAVAEAVATGRADLGVCVDGAGIGSSIAANKVPGVRAALCYDEQTARNAREHNFANVLSLGGPMLGPDRCRRVLEVFLKTPEGAQRHERRVDKIRAIEVQYGGLDRPLRRVIPETGATGAKRQ